MLSFDNLLRSTVPSPEPSPDDADDRGSAVDYKKHDYRGFVFVHHPAYGLMMLKCTRKKNKPVHYQLPGGHVDDFEFEAQAGKPTSREQRLQMAARNGCARELYEETGIDVRSQLNRLKPVGLRDAEKNGEPPNAFHRRLFYLLEATDDDFLSRPPAGADTDMSEGMPPKLTAAEDGTAGSLMLRLSIEHAGFRFETSADKCRDLLQHHSGGKVSTALEMACSGAS